MGQRVNIQYTIDLDELPDETRKLIKRAVAPLDEAKQCLREIQECDDTLSTGTLDCVDQIRQKLMNVDYVLQDVQNIVKGYLAHVSGVNEKAEPTSQTEDMYGLPPSVDMDDLEKRLNNFKDTFSGLENANNEEPNQKQNT
tara:strand:+ start:2093 stop:2515 length:423 start_codon:yes stop_codon:yes gene_type:complete